MSDGIFVFLFFKLRNQADKLKQYAANGAGIVFP